MDIMDNSIDVRLESAKQFLREMQTIYNPTVSLETNFLRLCKLHVPALAQDETLLWDVYALTYTHLESLRPYKELQDKIIERAGFRPGLQVANLACGPANLERRAATEGLLEDVDIVGVDFSEAMLAEAKRNYPLGEFRRHDLRDPLDFIGSVSKDLFICVNAFGFLDEDEGEVSQLAKEGYRILKPNGKGIITTQKRSCNLGIILMHHANANDPENWSAKPLENFASALERAFGNEPHEIRKNMLNNAVCNVAVTLHTGGDVKYTPSKQEFESLLRKAGFLSVRIEPMYGEQYLMADVSPSPRPEIDKTYGI